MRHVAVLIATTFLIVGCQGGQERLVHKVAESQIEQVENCDDCTGRVMTLASGIGVTCKRGKTGFIASLTYAGQKVDLPLERDASFYGFASHPGIVVVIDRYASNEDQLVFISLDDKCPRREIVEHDSCGYIHNHFYVLGADQAGIQVREEQYAGADPPRLRRVVLSIGATKVDKKNGPWEKGAVE